jgi:hypothetical protein
LLVIINVCEFAGIFRLPRKRTSPFASFCRAF